MHPHESLIREFYAAFARRDAEAMARCYHDEVFFSDPAFPALRGEEARDMWRMLVGRAPDLSVVLDEASADAEGGRARRAGDRGREDLQGHVQRHAQVRDSAAGVPG